MHLAALLALSTLGPPSQQFALDVSHGSSASYVRRAFPKPALALEPGDAHFCQGGGFSRGQQFRIFRERRAPTAANLLAFSHELISPLGGSSVVQNGIFRIGFYAGPMHKGLKSAGYSFLRRELVSAREAQGLTQADLARALGRSQSFVSKYEVGERRLDVVDFVLVCRSLGIDAGKLVSGIQQQMAPIP